MKKMKLIRSSTVPISLKTFLQGSIEPLMNKYELVLLSSPDKVLDELHLTYGGRTLAVHMERHISVFKDLKALLILVEVFCEERPYMVHSMTPKAGLLCMIAAWIARVPRRVHTFTGLVWPTEVGAKRKLLMFMDKIMCACATHIIPEGVGVKNDLNEHITNKQMRVLGFGNVRGVDLSFWQKSHDVIVQSSLLKDELNIADTFNFLFVGRLVGDKGINELVEAFCKLHQTYPNIRLLIVGPSEAQLDPLDSATWDRVNNSDSILNIGPIWGEDILKYYSSCHCFVFPSYREGFPNTVLEAGAMGLPSIVTDINGSREIIVNGENGLIIPSKDADALYDAMKLMFTNEPMRSYMSVMARPMIANRFEQSFVRQCMFDYYDEIM